ncbi:P-loop containing nucleoside triphosphate hydrolase protein [Astrocystis sublimbata]|nr:P-loop containing nucleoside triphosphate hydrolase protein [Astrocystis sublimbata]
MPPVPTPRWLLLSDIHFRLRDIERARRTAEWIVSLASHTPGISRVVVCGDVLTSRSMQPTAVISAAYRFLSDLSSSVPHVNVILGNHDLAYRRDYSTTALEALNMSRLRPFVSLHDKVERQNWDGRDVLILPFREDQGELTDAVANLDPHDAARTVAFAHLALNKAITQRHIVRDDTGDLGYSIRYKGFTSPDHFSALARTFTGHFHSHQIMLRSDQNAEPARSEDRLQGSVSYLGAPLQLTWADLCDEDRGVVLLDPATLEHELIVNPHAVAYMTVQGSEVLDDGVESSTVSGKHVMILGRLTRFQYWTARDKLLSLGAQSVREPRQTASSQNGLDPMAHHGLGASIPESDKGVALTSTESGDLPGDSTTDEQNVLSDPDDLQTLKVDLTEYVPGYVRSLAEKSTDDAKITELGQRLLVAAESTFAPGDDAAYKLLLDPSYSLAGDDSQISTEHVFVARPRSIAISNFLGIQDECTIDLDRDLGRGLTFVTGHNGSGKSTLIEAIVWCQFGRCLRKGLSVGDVVNDATGKNCVVSLSFSNGYTITRYRKHKTHGNRVIVSLHGVEQPHFEHGETRNTQAAIDELLGIDYEEFIKTVVLGHESAASFLSSTPAQRYELIESTLGLSTLDKSGDLSRRMLRQIDADTASLRNRISTVEQTMSHIEDRLANRNKELTRLRKEEQKAKQDIENGGPIPEHTSGEDLDSINTKLEELKLKIKESRESVKAAQSVLAQLELAESVNNIPPPASKTKTDSQKTKGQYQLLRDELLKLNPGKLDQATMEHIQCFESTVRGLTQIISWLQFHLLKATTFFGSDSPMNRTTVHFLKIGLKSLDQLSQRLNGLLGQFTSSISKQQQEYEDTIEGLVKRIETKFPNLDSDIIKLIEEKREGHNQVAPDQEVENQTESSSSKNEAKIALLEARQQLSFSLAHLSKLLDEQGVLHELQAKRQHEMNARNEVTRERKALRGKLADKEREIAIYWKLMKEETTMLESQRASHTSIGAEIESLMSTREMFAFWEDSLSRRRSKSTVVSTFRGYVLDKSLQELNAVASNILLVLYENTRHARELTKGMLRTIIAPDAGDDHSPQDAEGPQGSVTGTSSLLDQTLSVTKTLSYAKRSGGERKRIDLAVFFALVQIMQAHSRHRARYILVDEAFDSLDAAGQSAVVRWCSQLRARTDFQLVITHSDYLVNAAQGRSNDEENGDELESGFSVMSATMTTEGTKFSNERF